MKRIHPTYFEHRQRVASLVMSFTEAIPEGSYYVEIIQALHEIMGRCMGELAKGDVYQVYPGEEAEE